MDKKHVGLSLLLVTIALYALCYALVTHIYIFWEVSWHIEGAKRMLAGASYITNLVDDNSPTVFAFYIPYNLIKDLLPIAPYKLVNLYILFVFLIANYTSLIVIKNRLQNRSFMIAFYLAGVVATIFIAVTILGQRENIFFALTFPYILMNLFEDHSLCGITQKKVALPFQVWVGLLAAIGVSQLPFYFLIPISIDIISWFSCKKRPQAYQITFYLSFFFISFISYILYPEYYNFLLILLYHFQTTLDKNYTSLMRNGFFGLTAYSLIISMVMAFYFYRKLIYVKLISLVLVAIVVYFFEKKDWFYHYYPIICYLFLLLVTMLVDIKSTQDSKAISKLVKILFSTIGVLCLLAIFTWIAFEYVYYYRFYSQKDNYMRKLIAFGNATNPSDNNTLFFSTRVYPAYLLTIYSKLNIVSPWANNWMLPTLVNAESRSDEVPHYTEGQNFFYQLVSQSLDKNPQYIIYYQAVNTPYIDKKNFDVLTYLRKNKKIANQLEQYTIDQEIDQYRILKRK